MEAELLQTIADNTDAKDSFYIVVTSRESSTVTSFSPPIIFRQRNNGDTHYEMALVGLNTYYSFPNVTETNNKIGVGMKDVPKTHQTIVLGVGCYEVNQINKEITRMAGWDPKDPPITFKPNNTTLKTLMKIKKDWMVNFAIDDSLAPVLGFEEKEYYVDPRHESEHTVDILKVNSILVYCDIITGSRVDGVERPIIYHFSPNVAPGIKIVIEPQQPIYLPVTVETISQMTVWLTDQDNRPIDLRGEKVVLNFHVRAR